MTLEHVVHPAPAESPEEAPWRLPDPPKKPRMLQHAFFHMPGSTNSLRYHFQDRPDAIVIPECYVCFDTRASSERLVADLLIAFDIDPEIILDRRGFVIDYMGKSPELVMEIASESTGRRDVTVKKDGYERFRVREYWTFDHTGGDYHGVPISGYELVGDKYAPIDLTTNDDGSIWGYSRVLGLYLCWMSTRYSASRVVGNMRFFDPATGEYLPDADGERNSRIAVEAELDAVKKARAAAEAELDAVKKARAAAEAALAAKRNALAAAQAALAAERNALAAARTGRDAAEAAREAAEANRDAAIAELEAERAARIAAETNRDATLARISRLEADARRRSGDV